MCDGAIGAGLQLAGGIFSSMQAKRQGDAARDYYDFLANETLRKADITTEQLYRQGGLMRSTVETKGRQAIASARAAMAANGITADSVTYDDVIRDSVGQSTLDELAVEYAANEKAREVRDDANTQYSAYKSAGDNAGKAGQVAQMGGLLSTAGQFANTWGNWSQTSMGQKVGVVKPQSSGYSFTVPKYQYQSKYTPRSSNSYNRNGWW